MVTRRKKKVRYAVVGLGHIAQAAVLPEFAHAKYSELAALVSDDEKKLAEMGDRYGVERRYLYEQYDECLQSGDVDAVFIALPNHLHAEYTIRAARAGVHILCEKPMAVTEDECQSMILAAREREVKLMIAYRLHFEKGNLEAVEIVRSGRLGNPRLFASTFTMKVRPDNIRIEADKGGGTLYDIGIYCINAARMLFHQEPIEVVGQSVANAKDERFEEVDETTSAILRFPDDRLATFTSSFSASDIGMYQIAGTEGDLRVEPAYSWSAAIQHFLTIDGKTQRRKFAQRGQFAAEIEYFSKCVLDDTEPEPSGIEGLADVRIIRAIYRSAESGAPVRLEETPVDEYPDRDQEITRPTAGKAETVHVESPHY